MYRFFLISNAILTVAVVLAGLLLGMKWYSRHEILSGEEILSIESITEMSEHENSLPGAVDTENILRKDIFRTVIAKKEMSLSDTKNLPPTKLELVLRGTAMSDHGNAFAFIMDKTKKLERVYQEGEFVAGARVKKIFKEQVILEIEDRSEVLQLSKDTVPSPKKAFGLKKQVNVKRPQTRLKTGKQ